MRAHAVVLRAPSDAALPACQLEAGKEQCSLCSVAGRRAECRHRS